MLIFAFVLVSVYLNFSSHSWTALTIVFFTLSIFQIYYCQMFVNAFDFSLYYFQVKSIDRLAIRMGFAGTAPCHGVQTGFPIAPVSAYLFGGTVGGRSCCLLF